METKILAIGNSFSEDATYYLHRLTAAVGIPTRVVNLYIGGCSLERHWQNVETGEAAYQYQLNGEKTDRYVSINEMLTEEPWDYIVTQQASHDSGWQETYEPFLTLLKEEIHRKAPRAELLLQQTWAYEMDSPHPNFMRYHRNQREMYDKLSAAYRAEAERHRLRLIPCGDIVQQVRGEKPFDYQNGGSSLCRDGFHMSFLYGRYLLAGVWASVLFSAPLCQNPFVPTSGFAPGELAEPALLQVIQKKVDEYFSASA